MSERISFLFSKEDIARIKFSVQKDGKKLVTVDMHGLRAKDARKFIKNLVAINKEGYDMCFIHGYNHGTAIKEIIWNEKLNNRITDKRGIQKNPGITYLSVAAA